MNDIKTTSFQYHPLWVKYREEKWHKDIVNYLYVRFPQIVKNISECFNYVDFHPNNKDVFSYEFSSVLRDIGGVFSSALDCFLTNLSYPKNTRYYNFEHFRDFLYKEMSDLEQLVIYLNVSNPRNCVLPFLGFFGKKHNSCWWDAYNNIKHNEVNYTEQACLSNILYAFSALTSLHVCITNEPHFASDKMMEITNNIISGVIVNDDVKEDLLFPFPSYLDVHKHI